MADGKIAALGGETREVTVLFTDIAGFTTTVEDTPPGELLEALGDYLSRQDAAIQRGGGNVTAFLGDGLMAVFGAPVPAADHALRGCRAALAARDQARALVEQARQAGRPAFPTRIGLNTGEVLVGNIGSPQRFDYTAIGDVVNTASRIEGLNKLYGTQVLVGDRTRRVAGEAMVFRTLELLRMKGKLQPVLVHELIDEAGQVAETTTAAYRRYEGALERYWARDFAGALREFEAVAEALGGDGPSELLASSCREFLESPPGEDWDGTRVMRVK